MFKANQIDNEGFETRYEWLRPRQLVQRREECPLVLFPIAPLEYHGPHLPVGTDPINASRVAHACCRAMQKGVVRPILTIGTEREHEPRIIESLGFEPGSHIVGMDFPARQGNSHYLPEEVFAAVLDAELRILIGQGYRYIFITNGHGAPCQLDTIRRLCVELSNTTEAKLDFCLTVVEDLLNKGIAGHAGIVETSLMMHYDSGCVDLNTLPERDVPIRYTDFSIVDGAGFDPDYKPEQYDPVQEQVSRILPIDPCADLLKMSHDLACSHCDLLSMTSTVF